MRQPISNSVKCKVKKTKEKKPKKLSFGTSKLEDYFAINFLDKLGVKYEYQKEIISIGRTFDFYLPEHNVLIEVDGDYYHFNEEVMKKPPNRMQKKNKRADDIKNRWALLNCIVLLRIWENDIKNNPSVVMNMLEKRLSKEKYNQSIIQKKKTCEFYLNKK